MEKTIFTKQDEAQLWISRLNDAKNKEEALSIKRKITGIFFDLYKENIQGFKEAMLALDNTYLNLGNIGLKKDLETLSKKIEYEMSNTFDFTSVCKNIIKSVPLWFDEKGYWWLFSNNKWGMVDEIAILSALNSVLKVNNLLRNNNYHPFFKALKIEARLNAPTILSKEWIQFNDEIYNYLTGERKVLTSNYFILNSLPHKLGKDEPTPIIDKLFQDWVGKDNVETLLDISCYCLLRDYPIQRIFILLGPGGNGKGSFMNLLMRLVGINNFVSSSLERISENRFETANIMNKLICSISETNIKTLKETTQLKMMCSGNDLLCGEFKGKNPIYFVNYGKIFISSNSLPQTKDNTDGFHRRMDIIDFPNHFVDGKNIIDSDSLNEDELSNFLFKLVKRLHVLLNRGFIAGEGSFEDRKKKYEEKSNPFKVFIDSRMGLHPDFFIPKWKFSEEFKVFLKNNNYRDWSPQEVGSALRSMGFESRKKSFKDYDNPIWCILGMDFKENCTKPLEGLDKFISDSEAKK